MKTKLIMSYELYNFASYLDGNAIVPMFEYGSENFDARMQQR